MDPLIAGVAERIVGDLQANPAQLWDALEDHQLTRIWAADDNDSQLSIADGLDLLRISATKPASVAYAETLFASWLLTAAGLSVPKGCGSIGCGGVLAEHRYTVKMSSVPFAGQADWLVFFDAGASQLVLLQGGYQLQPVPVAGDDPAAFVTGDGVVPSSVAAAPSWLDHDVFQSFGALLRSAQLCGAMEATLDLCIAFASGREQFGRPLSKFQAIQHMLAEMAGEVSAAVASLDAAGEVAYADAAPATLAVASAACRSREAAGIVATHAHQIHGAIGYTDEYSLARLTGRLWRWREDYGNETYWSVVLGQAITAVGAPALTEQVFGAVQ